VEYDNSILRFVAEWPVERSRHAQYDRVVPSVGLHHAYSLALHFRLWLYVLPGVPPRIPCRIWISGSGLWFMNLCEPEPNVLSVQFRFREALNPNWTERTVQVGSGSGSGIFPNRTVGPVQGLGKFTPEPDRTEPQ